MNPTIRNVILSGVRTREQLVKSAGGVLYLDARKADGSGLPINSPLTTPWQDLSINGNNATPVNMASTSSSGYNESIAKPGWTLDGVDDRFSLVNTASVDVTERPLAVFMTVKTPIQTGYLFCKNFESVGEIQYGMYYNSSANDTVILALNGVTKGQTATGYLTSGNIYNLGFIWTADGNVKMYINGVQSGNTVAVTDTLTTRSNVNIGCRGKTGGTQHVFYKGDIHTTTIYSGANCTTANVLKAEKEISKQFIS